MLLAPLYHQVDGQIEKHLSFFSRYPSKLPGEPLEQGLNICITFDDATEDFYQIVFPLLKKFQLKALLAVPTQFVGQTGYCSWQELEEMSASRWVKIASHSVSHPNLTEQGVDLDFEIRESKKILEKRLGIDVNSFVYPYGKFTKKIHARVKSYYDYVFRIGMAYNYGWSRFSGLIYRITADEQKPPESLLKKKYFWNLWMNLLRGR